MSTFFHRAVEYVSTPMALLSLLFFIMMMYAIERTLFLHSSKIRIQQFIDGIIVLMTNKRHSEAIKICETTSGCVPTIIKTILIHRTDNIETLKCVISEEAAIQIPLLEKRIGSIRLIAKLAPIISFIAILQSLSKTLSYVQHEHIYLDATTTVHYLQTAITLAVFGLTVNIFGALIYNFLYGRIRRLINDMEWSCNIVMEQLTHTERDSHVVK